MLIDAFFDKDTATFSYLLIDETTGQCAIIDPVLHYDPVTGRVSTAAADRLISVIKNKGLTLAWIFETHIHADHLTAAVYLKENLGGQIGVGIHILDVLQHWVPLFNAEQDTPLDGSQFDRLFADNETFTLGSLSITVMHTPGHTPACVSYVVGDAVFVGDTIFMPHLGTARTDFPGGDATTLYRSIHKLYQLPDATRVFVGHDYPEVGQEAAWQTTIAAQKLNNIMIREEIAEETYVKARQQRDLTLGVPRLLLPSLQVNLRAGRFGGKSANGTQYIKIPINVI